MFVALHESVCQMLMTFLGQFGGGNVKKGSRRDVSLSNQTQSDNNIKLLISCQKMKRGKKKTHTLNISSSWHKMFPLSLLCH